MDATEARESADANEPPESADAADATNAAGSAGADRPSDADGSAEAPESAKPGEPSESAAPAGSDEPAEPAQSAEDAESAEPVEPSEVAEPANSAAPTDPTDPTDPTEQSSQLPLRAGWFGWRRRYPRTARAVGVGTSVLAGALLLVAMVVPDRLDRMTFQSFLRLPVELIVLAVVLLALPSRARRITAVVLGAFVGLSAVLKCLDMGFYETLARPFDLVFDWVLLNDAADWTKDSFGRSGEVLAIIGVIVLLLAVLAGSALAMVRLADVMARHRPTAVRTTLVLGVAWIMCFTLSVQVGGVTLATKGYSQFLSNRVKYVRDGLGDADVFKKQLTVDAFAKTPPNQLLTGLRGKDVLFTFIESYGRVALDDPTMAPEMDKTLTAGDARLKAAGFSSRSAWLRSPVTGAGSWLAHSTFLSGLWIKNQQRYRTVTTSTRATLTSYFQKTGAWRTVGIVPGVRKSWPEGKYFGLDNIYDSTHLGYNGPYFSWTPVPDQFSLESFEKLEYGKKNRDPIMAEIILASSHNPWSPIAHTIPWNQLGDGTIFNQIKKEGTNPTEVWKSAKRVRTEYRKAIQYSVDSLTQWVQRYGNKNTVLVFLGDHQPVPTVTGGTADRDVPITIVAHDPKVLDKISSWGWTDGLKPADSAPVLGMDKFRDRFMTAYAK
ncbi:LTA synthase family protein [Streptomyces prunicolor]|uniref:Sulfatase n=1 Tax=Streptomyces prunicolor TaxID=67348 RepID=A0ABU4F1J1_9ACTN|nr:sulfatase [Streptomyces prunicolor]MDV7214439.1 sulfatase [Streptomyces prunicolor]